MFNQNLYNQNLYGSITYNPTLYDTSLYGLNFGNNILFPNSKINCLNFKYLNTREIEYQISRLTDYSLKGYDIKQIKGGLEITGSIKTNSRTELLNEIYNLKDNIFGEKEIIIKDNGEEYINNFVIENIEFEEEHYNITWTRFKILASYYENIKRNKTNVLTYSGITENNKEITFYNSGKETDYKIVFEIVSGDQEYSLALNGINIFTEELVVGDIIIIDTKNIEVLKNGIPIVFSGIISKINNNNNVIAITDEGISLNYNLSVKYKNSFN